MLVYLVKHSDHECVSLHVVNGYEGDVVLKAEILGILQTHTTRKNEKVHEIRECDRNTEMHVRKAALQPGSIGNGDGLQIPGLHSGLFQGRLCHPGKLPSVCAHGDGGDDATQLLTV